MLGGRLMAWLLALIAVVAIIGIASLASRPSSERNQIRDQQQSSEQQRATNPPADKNAEQQPYGRVKNQEQQDYWERFVAFVEGNEKFITAFSTLVIAAFTVVLAIATGFLFWATRDLVGGADEVAKRQLRAYIGILSSAIEVQPTVVGGPINLSIEVTLRNSGQTPAYREKGVIFSVIGEPNASPFSFPDVDRPANSIVAPGADMHLSTGLQINEGVLNALKAGKLKVFVWGRVDYDDAFGDQRFFVFRSQNSEGFYEKSQRWTLSVNKAGYEGN